MGWLDRLFGSPSTGPSGDRVSDTVRKIAQELDGLPAERAKFVAALAYVLGRVAYADHHVSEEESAAMERIVREVAGLPEAHAVLAVEIAKSQNRLFGSTENFIVTKEFRETASAEELGALLDALFAVSAADDSISAEEEVVIRQIATELGFTHQELVAARANWSEKRSVMQSFERSRHQD